MSKKDIETLKDPVLRAKIEGVMDNPSGDTVGELTEQDINTLAGAGIINDTLSKALGNQGRVCTLTKECQANCN